jgi:hypothetical protein
VVRYAIDEKGKKGTQGHESALRGQARHARLLRECECQEDHRRASEEEDIAMAKVRFKRGTIARKARSKIAEGVKRSGSARNPYAVATATVKRMSKSKRAKTARKR